MSDEKSIVQPELSAEPARKIIAGLADDAPTDLVEMAFEAINDYTRLKIRNGTFVHNWVLQNAFPPIASELPNE
jgi:hypothetical protein